MIATKYPDGKMRITLKVEIRVSRRDIIDCIGHEHTRGMGLDEVPRTKLGILDLVRRVRLHEGINVWVWVESVEKLDDVTAGIEAIVDKAFPELKEQG